MINTHNGIREKSIKPINIEEYPSVKKHLDNYYFDLEKRTDKGISPYNLRNCAYMEDFFRPKIIWKRIGSILRFSYDETGVFTIDSTCFSTGKYIKYLVAFLNSKFGKYQMKDSPQTGTGDLLISVQAIEPLMIPIPNSHTNKKFEIMIDEIFQYQGIGKSLDKIENEININIYQIFNLTQDEINFIESQ